MEKKQSRIQNVSKKINIRSLIAVYVFCAILIAFYFCVLVAPRDVCLEYEMYYVDKILTDWPGYGGLRYTIGTPVYFGSENMDEGSRRKGSGWSRRENGYSWTEGEKSDVYFHVDGDIPEMMEITVKIGDVICDSYDLAVNGAVLKSGLSGSHTTVSALVTRDLLNGEKMICVTIYASSPKRPCDIGGSAADGRLLGLQVTEMSISEVVESDQ